MAQAEDIPEESIPRRRFWPRRKRWRLLALLAIVLGFGTISVWTSRDRLADNFIASQLDAFGVEASYEIESIGPTRQVLRNFVVGDPDRPDLTIERVIVVPRVGFTGAGIGSVTLQHPRLRATYRDGQFSLGGLDPLLQTDEDAVPGLPNWSLNLVDARARIFSDFGVVGVKADGAGRLDGGFKGVLAAVAPSLAGHDCELGNSTLVGTIRVVNGRPGFDGPLDIGEVRCASSGVRLSATQVVANITGDEDLSGFEGKATLKSSAPRIRDARAAAIGGVMEFDWRNDIANARYNVVLNKVRSPEVLVGKLRGKGALRMRNVDSRIELDAGIEGQNLALGRGTNAALSAAGTAAEGTLIEPLLAQLQSALASNLAGSSLNGELTYRQNVHGFNLAVPAARISSRGGESLFALSQFQYSEHDGAGTGVAGSMATGGRTMPSMRGRIEQGSGGAPALRLELAPYRAGTSSLALPQVLVAQTGSGWSFTGRALASGEIPGGSVERLDLALEGRIGGSGELSLWSRCTQVGFANLELSGLALDRQSIRLCPAGAAPILRSGAKGVALFAKADGLNLTGALGDSPILIDTGIVTLGLTEGMNAQQVAITLGPDDAQSSFVLEEVGASFVEGTQGSISGVEIRLDAVPLDILAGEGNWRFTDGVVTLSDGVFEVRDRAGSERFEPLITRDATLQLVDNVMTASAALRNPESDKLVTEVSLQHDLSSGVGFADLQVPGLVFDETLQPEARSDQCFDQDPSIAPRRHRDPPGLSCLALGVIALADGVVTGSGRIEWNPDDISSVGSFTTQDFDFAAAFGPVENVSGTISFSDLLSLTTNGTQRLQIGAINPGVEVFDGTLDFTLTEGEILSLKGAKWPFFGGTMELRPTDLNLLASEERRYIIEITGADAAQFVAAMDLGNISATGIFDGSVPIVFDEMGNGEIQDGLLISRAPGGNLSYVGELTYEDTGVIANYAFQSLRSLDFSQMMVEMNGPLTGEIITRLQFDGIRQGRGANSNFVTRQIAKLPIRFRVNIRAAFYELMTSLKGMYDPAFVRDPRTLGLITDEGGRFAPARNSSQPAVPEPVEAEGELSEEKQSIQTEESEILP